METFETARLDRYFRAVTDAVSPAGAEARSFLITHVLADRPAFVRAVDRVAAVAAVLAKPKSADRAAVHTVGLAYPVDPLSRERFADPDIALAYLEQRAAGAAVVTTLDVALQAEEVHDFAWLPAAEVEPAWLAERIAAITSSA